MSSPEGDTTKKPPIERYFAILELLTAFPDGLQLRDLAEMLDVPKPSLHRLLAMLVSLDLVRFTEGPGQRYALGERMQRLVFLSAGDSFIISLAAAHLKQLSGEFGETCYVARLEGSSIRSVVMDSPASPWRGFVLPGKDMHPHATASAKAIAAFQPQTVIEEILAKPLMKLTSFTNTDKQEILNEYARIRADGYATCIDEIEEGLAAFAVPIISETWGAVYSIAILGPKARILTLLENGAIARFQQAASAISSALSERGRETSHPS